MDCEQQIYFWMYRSPRMHYLPTRELPWIDLFPPFPVSVLLMCLFPSLPHPFVPVVLYNLFLSYRNFHESDAADCLIAGF